jgi:hypothetical protein
MNLTAVLAMLKEDPKRRKQYQQILSKAHACLIKCGNPEEPEMCGALSMILAWHQHGDLTSFPIMMQDFQNVVPQVSIRDPRLGILDFQLFSMGENATPSQLRSLTMSNATEDLGGNVISAKDLLTVGSIMKKIDEALSGSHTKLPVGEGLWEIALKLRIQASEAVEAVAVGCLPKMAAILSAQHYGGWSRVAKCSDSNTFAKLKMHPSKGEYKAIGEGDDFFDCIRLAEMAGSVLHEICRYRSGEEQK